MLDVTHGHLLVAALKRVFPEIFCRRLPSHPRASARGRIEATRCTPSQHRPCVVTHGHLLVAALKPDVPLLLARQGTLVTHGHLLVAALKLGLIRHTLGLEQGHPRASARGRIEASGAGPR